METAEAAVNAMGIAEKAVVVIVIAKNKRNRSLK
tara:strand:- start:310 stop:411 length:102 start_codon:yes stop_codon:yes gene_type:complete